MTNRFSETLSKRGKLFNGTAIGAFALLFGSTATSAMAQDAPASNLSETEDVIIVIGTAGGKGINRQEASFAVTTFDPEQLETIQPKSTADLLKSVPGIWAESSGGVAGANIDVRGLPGGGDAPFVAFSINGSPIYGFNSLSFFEGSTAFRIDETISSVEALRGGPNSVFAKGEPGATINFNLKEGGEETTGRVKYTTSDYDLQRFDGVISGKIADDLYYMAGGYIQRSPGIRDAEFTSEEGVQFTAQLTKLFDNGKVNIYTRLTDDHGQWYLPFSVNNPNLDLGTFSQLGNATRLREIVTDTNGSLETFDFADGRGWKGAVSGANIEFDLGNGFTLRDNVSYTKGDANTLGFVNAGNAILATDLEASIGRPVTLSDGTALGGDDFVQTYGHWVVLKELENFSNDLSLNKKFGAHDVTVGLYTSSIGADDWWSIGNPIPVHNVANGGLLDPTITPADIADAGGNAGFNFGLQSGGDAQINALYIADTWDISDKLRIDLGIRSESIDIEYVLDTGPGFPDGVIDQTSSIDGNEIAFTGAANYTFNDKVSVFARYSDGHSFPHFDQIREGNQSVLDVKQFEGGVKFNNDWLRAYLTGYRNTTDAFSSVVGGTVPPGAFETRATGLELEGDIMFSDSFRTSFGATLQDAEITASDTGLEGNTVLRQPDWQFRISPQINFSLGNSLDVTAYSSITAIGERFGSNVNLVVLPSFEKVDLGAIVRSDSGIFFQVHADNIGDSSGFTEGNPRNPLVPVARPILGRSVKFTVGYDF